MGFSPSQDFDEPLAEINIVPLVDIMLVLLIIFMVAAPMLQQGVEVDLPKTTTAPLRGSNEQVVLSIDKSGLVYLGADNKVELDALAEKVNAIMSTRAEADRKIYIKADQGLEYGVIMDVMGRLHAGGITQIGLVSGQPDKSDKKSEHK